MAIQKGQRVKFRPTHHKELELTGVVTKIHADGKSVDVKSEAGNGSVSRIYTAHVNDCAAVGKEEKAKTLPPDAGELIGFVQSRGYSAEVAKQIVTDHTDEVRADFEKSKSTPEGEEEEEGETDAEEETESEETEESGA